jgi:hypothetical protein
MRVAEEKRIEKDLIRRYERWCSLTFSGARFGIAAITCLCVHIASAGTVSYSVVLNTEPLIGDVAGPFSVAFQLSDGSGHGHGNNTVTLSDFDFGGGNGVGMANVLGGITGSLESSISITESLFLNYYIQQFDPGTFLSFDLTTTTNANIGSPPDEFLFSILDNTGQQLPTQTGQPFLDPFVAITINSSNPTLQSFPSDPAQPPAGGGPPLDISAPVVTSVPEPCALLLSVILSSLTFIVHCFNSKRLN